MLMTSPRPCKLFAQLSKLITEKHATARAVKRDRQKKGQLIVMDGF
jgi:hypothetical protein